MPEQNKAIARKVFEDIQSQGNLALIDEIVAGNYVGHTPITDIHGPDGAKQFDAMLHEAFPEMQVTVEDQSGPAGPDATVGRD